MSTLISPVGIGGFPFNSNNGDRVYDASDFAEYFARIVRSGVFRIPEGQLRVTCSQGMTLSVAPGAVYACGVCASIDDAKTVTLAYGDAALPRIDRVVARLDRSARELRLGVLQGTPAVEPSAPPVERGSDFYDLCLCEVSVPAGAVTLASSNLVDRRSDTSVCGWVGSIVTDLPASVTQGLVYTASENGGTGAAYTAAVDGVSAPPDDGTHITVVPAADAEAGATLSVNGDAARPVYSSENAPVGAKGLIKGVPVELIYNGGKYFFKAAGGFSRYATGSLTQGRTFTVSDLTFRPKLLILYGQYYGNNNQKSYVCVGLFDVGGELIIWRPTYQQANVTPIDPSLDTVTVSDSGFSVTFGMYNNVSYQIWPTGSTGATVQYFCYA